MAMSRSVQPVSGHNMEGAAPPEAPRPLTRGRGQAARLLAVRKSRDARVRVLRLCSLVVDALTIALALLVLSRAASTAATVELYRLRRIDHTVEISFAFRGRALQWHLSGNKQELTLNLEE